MQRTTSPRHRLTAAVQRTTPVVAVFAVVQVVAALGVLAVERRSVVPAAPVLAAAQAPVVDAPALPASPEEAVSQEPVAEPTVPAAEPSVEAEVPPPAPATQESEAATPAPADTGEAVSAPAPAPRPRSTRPATSSAARPPARPAAPAAAAPAPAAAAPAGSASVQAFAREHPAQAAATRIPGDPAGNAWAVLVGINDYAGGMTDNIGSSNDAQVVADVLIRSGWRADHIVVLRDRAATHDAIVRALEWLIRSTDDESKVIFSFSGHVRQSKREGDVDRDGEKLDEGLWAADNRYVWDADLSRMLAGVRSQVSWVTIQGCEAAGFNDPGMERPGRVVTYSSREDQKSYEDPEVALSVAGRFFFGEALRDGYGDADGDHRVTIQEGLMWAAPRMSVRTSGRQSAILVDGLGRPFSLGPGER